MLRQERVVGRKLPGRGVADEREVHHRGTVGAGVGQTGDEVRGEALVGGVENLDHEQTHPGGQARDPEAVAGVGQDDSCDRGPVAVVVGGIRIVVDKVITRPIEPLKIRLGEIQSRVEHRHGHACSALPDVPQTERADIGPGNAAVLPGIGEVPLLREVGVVGGSASAETHAVRLGLGHDRAELGKRGEGAGHGIEVGFTGLHAEDPLGDLSAEVQSFVAQNAGELVGVGVRGGADDDPVRGVNAELEAGDGPAGTRVPRFDGAIQAVAAAGWHEFFHALTVPVGREGALVEDGGPGEKTGRRAVTAGEGGGAAVPFIRRWRREGAGVRGAAAGCG